MPLPTHSLHLRRSVRFAAFPPHGSRPRLHLSHQRLVGAPPPSPPPGGRPMPPRPPSFFCLPRRICRRDGGRDTRGTYHICAACVDTGGVAALLAAMVARALPCGSSRVERRERESHAAAMAGAGRLGGDYVRAAMDGGMVSQVPVPLCIFSNLGGLLCTVGHLLVTCSAFFSPL